MKIKTGNIYKKNNQEKTMNEQVKFVSEELCRIGKNSTQIIYDKYLEELMKNPDETKFIIEIYVGDTRYRTFIDKNKNCVGVIYIFNNHMCGVIVIDDDIERQIELAIYMNYVHVMFNYAVVPKSKPLPFLMMRRYTTGESIYSFVLQSNLSKLNGCHHYFSNYEDAWEDFVKH